MPILSIGLNYRTAPVEVREEIALEGEGLFNGLAHLNDHPAIDEVVILSTCNRTEIYVSTDAPEESQQVIENLLAQRARESASDLTNRLYCMTDGNAIGHLLRVACGLDSLILGEPQILGQVNNAFQLAQAAKSCGPVLTQLFVSALRAGKRARAETEISRHTTSTSHAAILLARSQMDDFSSARILIVGAGDMATLAIKALRHQDVAAIGCINRTRARAQALAQQIDGQVFNWSRLSEALIWADVVITATGAPHTVIHEEEVAETLAQRNGRPLIMIDIALPRDVEEAVGELPGVILQDIDDLQTTLDINLAQREAARPKVNQIILEESEAFHRWQRSRRAVPILVNMRRKVEELAQTELAYALEQMPDLNPEEAEVMERMVHRLVNKVLHEPTVQLKEAAADSKRQGHRYAEVVQNLFGLEPIPGHRYQNQAGEGMLGVPTREESHPTFPFPQNGRHHSRHQSDDEPEPWPHLPQ